MQKLSFLKESFVLLTQLFLFCLVKAISYRTLKKWGKCWSKKYTMSRGKKLNKKELRRMRKSAPVDIDKHCSQPDMSLCKNCVLIFCTHSHTLFIAPVTVWVHFNQKCRLVDTHLVLLSSLTVFRSILN
jgi:hypothetical protein